MKYQLKPPTVDAFQWQGDIDALNLFLQSVNAPPVQLVQTKNVKTIKLQPPSDGFHAAAVLAPAIGDWMIWFADGKALSVATDAVFQEQYQAVP